MGTGIRPALESEKTILGAILLENSVINDVADRLCPDDFGIDFHKTIFRVMIMLHKKHGSIDVPMIVDELGLEDEEECYVYKLANYCVSTSNVKSHADIVREKSVQRQLVETLRSLNKGKKAVSQADVLADFLEEISEEIRSAYADVHYLRCTLFEISKAFVNAVDDLEE